MVLESLSICPRKFRFEPSGLDFFYSVQVQKTLN